MNAAVELDSWMAVYYSFHQNYAYQYYEKIL